MRRKRIFHFSGAGLEDIDQVPVAALEILEYFAQLLRSSIGTEPQNPADDMVGPDLVDRIEVSGFSRWFEGSDDDPRRIRTQIQNLAM